MDASVAKTKSQLDAGGLELRNQTSFRGAKLCLLKTYFEMPAGRKPKPTRLKLITGNPGKRPGGMPMKFGWFGWFGNYQGSRDNSKEIEKGWIVKGETLADLANKLEIEPAELEASIARWNENCANGNDSDFGRPDRSLTPIEKAPFYCVKVYPATFNTQGGPKRNAKCQVVDPFDQPIPGLYSAGELGSFWGWMYNGGGNNAEALCTGRIAATNIMKKQG